jgi:hypothetical protein
MKSYLKLAFLWMAFACALPAAVPPAEQLLPSDTLLLLTVPDWAKTTAFYTNSPQGQLWRDPELKAFRDKFIGRVQTEIIDPLERELNVKLADYAELLRGQVTLGVTLNGWDGASDFAPGLALVIDTQDKSELLKTNLAGLKKNWADSGKQITTLKIRDIEFTTITFTEADLSKTLRKALSKQADKGADNDKSSTNKVELTIGQSDTLLLVANSTKDLEKILIRQGGGASPVLADLPEFRSSQPMFQDSFGFSWLNFKPILNLIAKKATAATDGNQTNSMLSKPDKIISAIGLDGVKTAAVNITASPEGSMIQVFVGAPAAQRKGLVKILEMEPKSANPPPFVPADAVKFSRWRLDGQKTFATIEGMLTEIAPQISSMIQMGLNAVGKDKDPNFDLKKSLIGNLGDDIITYQKNPRDFTFAALNSPPTITLIGSTNAAQLFEAMKTGTGLLIPPNALKERDFSGHKIISIPLPASHDDDADSSDAPDKMLSIAAGDGYVALSTDAALLEEYLKPGENKPKPLSETPGLNEAALKVGGMTNGFFTYENQSETMRTTIETLKKDTATIERLFNENPLGKKADATQAATELKTWFDFSLLPPFEKISKYFSFVVAGGATSPEGLGLKYFSPTPAALKK